MFLFFKMSTQTLRGKNINMYIENMLSMDF
jgi:hypothetical protein